MTRPTILAYHAVGECPRSEDRHNLFVTTEAFEQQMSFLRRRRNVVGLDDVVDHRVSRGHPAVVITFDDAYRSVLRNAGPILSRYGFPATVFVPTAWRGQVNGWVQPSSCDLEIMDDAELKQSEAIGISLESHGHMHLDMSDHSPEEVEEDIITSLDILENLTGRRPRFLAYPYGRVARWTADVAASTGISAAFTIEEAHRGRFAYGRVQVTPLDTAATFTLKTTGRYLRLRHSRVVKSTYGAVKPLVRTALHRRRI